MNVPAPEHNLALRLLLQAADHPDRPAIIQGERTITYAELERSVQTTAAVLRRLGVRPQACVALLFPNHHRFVEAMLATIRIGAVAVPLNTRAGSAALRHVVADCAATVLVAHAELADRATELAAAADSRILIVGDVGRGGDVGGDTGNTDGTGDDEFRLSGGEPVRIGPGQVAELGAVQPVRPEDICLQPYTSGSTGTPKGCLLTHSGQHWNASTVAEVWELGADDRGLVTAPLYHKNAMICVVKPLLLRGGAVVIGESPQPAGIPAEVQRHGCTYTTGVPATYQMLLDSREHERHDLSSLRFVICGSAPLSDEFGRRIADGLGAPVLEAYGLTEGGPQVLMTPRNAPPRYGKAGRPMPGCEVRLLDVAEMPETPVSALAEVPTGTVGEMWVRNPGVTAGYHGLPEVTRARISADGWLRTGDLAVADEDGWFQVLGRADDMMNVGGENVYPVEVEQLLLTLPEVAQAAVVPVPHPTKGQVPVAFVKAGGLTEEQIKAYCLAEGAPHAHPRRVWFVDELPLGGTGKVDRSRLIEMADERLRAAGNGRA